jgi:hypothetical protein
LTNLLSAKNRDGESEHEMSRPAPDIQPTPPHSDEAEKATLSSIIQDESAILRVQGRIDDSAFFNPVHRRIFREACAFREKAGSQFDLITFTQYLREQGVLADVGGPSYVTELYAFVPTSVNVEYYIDIVVDKKARRDAIKQAEHTIDIARDESVEFLSAESCLRNGCAQNFVIADLLTFDPGTDPTNLLGQRYQCEGGTIMWAGGAGYGKSSLVTQASIYWSIGQPFFGIKPVRPLKILIVQGENDFGDTAEQLQGAIRGIDASGDFPKSELQNTIASNLVFERVIGATGPKFLAVLRSLIQLHRPNLVFVDPLFAFAGCDLIDAPQMSAFLREGLIPLAVRNNVGVHVVHHIGKPARDNNAKQSWSELDYQYLAFGSSEIQNAFRGVNVLLPVSGHEGVFRLILSKRGSRAGALDIDGERTTTLYIQRAKTGIFWSQIYKPDPVGMATRFKAEYNDTQILEHMSDTEGAKTSELQKRVSEESGMSRRKFYEMWAELKLAGKIKEDFAGLWLKK